MEPEQIRLTVHHDGIVRDLRRASRWFFWSLMLSPLIVGAAFTIPLAIVLFRLARQPLGSRWAQRMTLSGVTALVAGASPWAWMWLATLPNGTDTTGDLGRYPSTEATTSFVVVGVALYAWAHLDVARAGRLPSLPHWWEKVLAPAWCAGVYLVIVGVAAFEPFGLSAGLAEDVHTVGMGAALLVMAWMIVRLIWAHDWILEDLDAAADHADVAARG